jgi:hypothetical protein
MNGLVVVSDGGLLLYADSLREMFGLGSSGPNDLNLFSSTLFAMHKISQSLNESTGAQTITWLQKVCFFFI